MREEHVRETRRRSWSAVPSTISTWLLDPPLALPLVVTMALVALGVWARLLQRGGDPRALIDIDGVFVLRLAQVLPGLGARVDSAAYRAQRILLPLLAAPWRVLGPDGAAWGMLVMNLAAVALGTISLAVLARSYGRSSWYGCVFGLWIGTLYGLHLGLTEPLAYSLVALALCFWLRERWLAAALALAAACLAKETAVLYVIALWVGARQLSWRRRLWLGLISAAPLALWEALLWIRFGHTGLQAAVEPGNAGVGMRPLIAYLMAPAHSRWLQIVIVALPATGCVLWGLLMLVRAWRARDAVGDHRLALGGALVLNGLFVASLPPGSVAYLVHSSRIGWASLLCLVWALCASRQRLLPAAIMIGLLIWSLAWQPGLYM